MIHKINELREMSDDEFEKLTNIFELKLSNYVKNNIANQFLTQYLVLAYKNDYLWEMDLERIVDSAIEGLELMVRDTYNIKKIKRMLEKEYNLKITNDKILSIKEKNIRKV